MRVRLLAAAGLAALAASCGGREAASDTVSQEEVAAQLAQVKVAPGRWQRTTEILAAEGAVSESERARIVGRRTSASDCITPAQAERPSANFLSAQQNSECTYHRFQMKDGKLESRTSCVGRDRPDVLVTVMTGDYAPDSYDMRTSVETSGPAGPVTITTRTRGRRVGACTPD